MRKKQQTEIGKLIALAREIKGWSLRDLEKQTGISNALINQIESGHIKEPGFHRVMRICARLGISPERIAKSAYEQELLGALRRPSTGDKP